MEEVSPLPRSGDVFFDPRDEGRFLRLSFHPELGVYVISLWRDDVCLGTHRLAVADLPRLLHALSTPIATAASAGSATNRPPADAEARSTMPR